MPDLTIGPFAQASLDEALGLAVGLRSVGLGERVLDAQGLAGRGKQPGALGAPLSASSRLTVTPCAR